MLECAIVIRFFFLLFCFLRFKLKKNSISSDGYLYSFKANSAIEPIAKNFGYKVKVLSKIDSIPWLDILTRKVRVLSIPPRELVGNSNEKWKRRFIKWLFLDVHDEIFVYWIYSLFVADYGSNILFVEGAHVAEIFSKHFPHFNVHIISNGDCSNQVRWVFECAFVTKMLKTNREIGITIFTNTTTIWIIEIYRHLHPNRKIILRFHDMLECIARDKESREKILYIVDVLKRKKIIDVVESYSREDAQDLGGIYRPNGVNPDFLYKFISPYRENICCFIGAGNNERDNIEISREHTLKYILTEIKKIYPNADRYYMISVPNFTKNRLISYCDCVKSYSTSEIYIDLVRIDKKEGFSFRIPEALWFNRKIISNRIGLLEENFYSPERIFLIGYDPITRLRTFLEGDLSSPSEQILHYYDSRLWWTNSDPYNKGGLLSDIVE